MKKLMCPKIGQRFRLRSGGAVSAITKVRKTKGYRQTLGYLFSVDIFRPHEFKPNEMSRGIIKTNLATFWKRYEAV